MTIYKKRWRRPETGASLVEFAFIAPFLLLLLLGIIEFGYLFGQNNEVRHAVREGARYAAVSYPDRDGGGVTSSDVVDAVCAAINLPGSTVTVQMDEVDSSGAVINAGGSGDRGDYGQIAVTATVSSLSGAPLITSFLPSQLSNSAVFRLEQDALWTNGASGSC